MKLHNFCFLQEILPTPLHSVTAFHIGQVSAAVLVIGLAFGHTAVQSSQAHLCHHTGVGGPALPGLPGSMALVPVTIRAPDGCLTMAYQLQPVPPFGSQDGPLTDVSGKMHIHLPITPCLDSSAVHVYWQAANPKVSLTAH